MAWRLCSGREPVWRRRRCGRRSWRLRKILSGNPASRARWRARLIERRRRMPTRRWRIRICSSLLLPLWLTRATRLLRRSPWRMRLGCVLPRRWRLRGTWASAGRRRRGRSCCFRVVDGGVCGLNPRNRHRLISAPRDGDPEVEVVASHDPVGARVGRGQGGLNASSTDENMRAVVEIVREVDERTSVRGRLCRLKPCHFQAEIGECRFTLPSHLVISRRDLWKNFSWDREAFSVH